MSLQEQLDRFAIALHGVHAGDPDAVSNLVQRCEAFAAAVDADGPLGEPLARAVELVRALADDGLSDHEDDLRHLEDIVSWAGEALEAMDAGLDVLPYGQSEHDQLDHELLSMFLDSAAEALSSIESELIAIEADPSQFDRFAQVKCVVHTLKGECGVIPLPAAQELLHCTETALDKALMKGTEAPVDVFLEVVDWMKGYLEQLDVSSTLPAPEHESLKSRIEAATSGAQQVNTAKEPEPEETSVAEPSAATIPPGELVQFPEDVLTDSTMPEFLTEARGHLEDSEAALLEIESDPEEMLELVDRVFRAFHTIKGVAGFMNLEDMVALAHSAETLLDCFRKELLPFSAEHISLVFEACDQMSSMLDYIAGEEPPARLGIYELIDRLNLSANPDAGSEGAEGEPETAPEVPRIGKMLVSEGLISEQQLEDALMVQKHLKNANSPKRLGELLVDGGLINLENLKAVLIRQRGASVVEGDDFPFAELVVSEGLMTTEELTKTVRAEPAPRRKKTTQGTTVKVATGRLDTLVDMVGELVIAQQMVTQDPELSVLRNPRLQRNLTQVAKITRDLQESAMSLRMVTLRSTFQKMNRLVRDVSSKAGKVVEFTVKGEDTELDRNVVEEISDPLVHLIRNAVDHGIEPPEERLERNKDPRGRIELSAYHQGGSIVIEIQDDGNGMNRDTILAKAMERGLVDQDPDDMSDSEVYKLIFQAGFSTAEQVTDISGRGVGMDVVRRNIEAMRGKIDIVSTPGAGSTFYLRLPLTLAIIDGMIVRVGSHRYVIPTLTIEQSFRPDSAKCHLISGGEMVDVRDKLLPVHRLRDVFDLNEGYQDLGDGILVLIEGAGERSCLFVDEILGQQQVVIKQLGKTLPTTQGISGGAILGDGRVALILDTDSLMTTVAETVTSPTAASQLTGGK